ncbi:PAS domain S-box protein [Candidatus Lokiarchaeum ossiferum]|uniref:PAS domain S-box protein n=1 Tax=Candidatus Lokiarchaeum ossiferum TaxID=2951803 RepID=UPI00352DBF77
MTENIILRTLPQNDFNSSISRDAHTFLETKYKVLFENTSDAIIIYENSKLSDCNEAAFKLLRYSSKEKFLSCSFLDFTPEFQLNGLSSLEMAQNVIKIAFLNGSHHFDALLKRSDGSIFPAEILLTARIFESSKLLFIVVRDISQRKQFLEELKISEKRFRLLFEESPLGIAYHQMIYDENQNPIDYIFLDYNKRFAEMTGLGDDIAGKTIMELIPDFQNRKPLVFENYKVVVKTGKTLQFESFHEESQTWFDVTAYSPRKGFFVSLLKDITDRKEVEIALNVSEVKYRAIYDSSHDAIMILVANKGFIEANIGTLKLFGIQQQSEFVGKTPADFSPKFQPDGQLSSVKADQMIQIALDTGSHFFEWVHQRTTGENFQATVLLNRMEIQGNVYVQARVHDISFIKSSEAERERLNAIIESTTDLISTSDAMQNLTFMNSAGLALLGIENKSDLSKMKIENIHPKWAFEKISREGIPTAIKNGVWRGETALISQNLVEIPVSQVIMTHCDDSGKVNFFSTIMRDISERKRIEEKNKQMEEELWKNQKMESIGFLAAGIAHDFNNFLTTILGNISLARSDDSALTPELREILEEVENASQRAKELTNQLLLFAKGDAPTKKLTTIQDLIIETCNFTLRGLSVKPTYDIAPDLWKINVDAGQISQVINNLILNAYQSFETNNNMENAVILIKACNTTDASKLNSSLNFQKSIQITVQDNGRGISPDVVPRIFDPYFTTKETGSGLGLSVCYSIVKKHGGHIEVESKIDEGSSFAIYLPVH